ncbi:uncharacterized protein LOC108914985 [Anoplophora glabripennis]|uniref:uncharacterized protein LOC108914985 n=1 Tax=Anoplophora glabripennis TaxID=217634 RepID=UPI0008758B89|nr:uncharacterized protein LOC108914985 [Anoplophora glabripennis]
MIRDGRVVIIPKDQEQKEKIETSLKRIEGVEVRERMTRDPMVIVSGVEKGITDEDFIERLARGFENMTATDAASIKIVRRVTCRNPWKENVILRVGVRPFKDIAKRGKVELGCELLFAEEYLGLPLCFRCCRPGHVMRACKEKEVCCRCMGEHDSRDCQSKELKCVSCWREYRRVVAHSARDPTCPALGKILVKSRKLINYGNGQN